MRDKKLDTLITSPANLVERLGRSFPTLRVLNGPEAGYVVRLSEGEAVVGRDARAQVRLDRVDVSRRHAVLQTDADGRVTINDAGSTNGTRVDGEAVRGFARTLANGARIQIGDTLLKLSYHDTLEEQLNQSLYTAAARDALTGAHNKRYLEDRFAQELAYSVRHDAPLALVLFDLDHFKRVNDTHGHLAGDLVLRATSEVVQRNVRCEDVFVRYGGEEFVVLMRNTTLEQAMIVVERIRLAIAGHEVDVGDARVTVTISTGVTERRHGAFTTAEQMLRRADSLLYAAKAGGRNRTRGELAA